MLAKPLMALRARGATSLFPPVHNNPQCLLAHSGTDTSHAVSLMCWQWLLLVATASITMPSYSLYCSGQQMLTRTKPLLEGHILAADGGVVLAYHEL